MRISPFALAALIAIAACSDNTPTSSQARAQRDSVAIPTVSASVAAPASLYSGYSPRSPHWQHITTMMTDFYYGWTPTERAWAGAHYDMAMSGSGAAWRAVNPTVGHYPYALIWTTIISPSSPNITTGYYADMKSWFAAHRQYSLERAFVHLPGTARTLSNRVLVTIWGSKRWAINPSDPGAIAYTVDRMRRVAGSESGVFLDETATGSWGNYLKASLEFPTTTAYSAAIVSLTATVRSALGTKLLMPNTSAYMTLADRSLAVVGGAAHLESQNDFRFSGMIDRWKWVESLNASGVLIDFVSASSTDDVLALGSSYPHGNSATSVQRAKLWELASYYMAVSASPKLLALQLENRWNKPYSTLWIRAQEANIGHPRAMRVQAKTGTDPEHNAYIVYTRDFDRALVVLRLQQGWGTHTYGDGTAIPISLPSGEKWIPLNADGSVGSPVTRIVLRNSEAAILLKGSKM
ncbi:MAG TPA: hypothetical protein VN717_11350 [Gemmatimonadaceae bacterium]|nr:hypothetical protein [Gemmatimonadaceae bacterium]